MSTGWWYRGKTNKGYVVTYNPPKADIPQIATFFALLIYSLQTVGIGTHRIKKSVATLVLPFPMKNA